MYDLDEQKPIDEREEAIEEEEPTLEDFDTVMQQFFQDAYAITKAYNNYDEKILIQAIENLTQYVGFLDYFVHTFDFKEFQAKKEEANKPKLIVQSGIQLA